MDLEIFWKRSVFEEKGEKKCQLHHKILKSQQFVQSLTAMTRKFNQYTEDTTKSKSFRAWLYSCRFHNVFRKTNFVHHVCRKDKFRQIQDIDALIKKQTCHPKISTNILLSPRDQTLQITCHNEFQTPFLHRSCKKVRDCWMMWVWLSFREISWQKFWTLNFYSNSVNLPLWKILYGKDKSSLSEIFSLKTQ